MRNVFRNQRELAISSVCQYSILTPKRSGLSGESSATLPERFILSSITAGGGGWFGRAVAVPLEALGIEGGHLVSLDMSLSEYAAAPTWRDTQDTPLPDDATVLVALS